MICWLISRPFLRRELTVHTQSGGTILQWLFGRIDPIQRTIHGQLSQHDDLRNKPSRPRVPFDSNSQYRLQLRAPDGLDLTWSLRT